MKIPAAKVIITKSQSRAKITKKAKILNLDPSNAETADEGEAIIWCRMKEGFAIVKDEIMKGCLSKKEQSLRRRAKGFLQA